MSSIKPCSREEARGKKYLDVYQSYFRILQRSKSAAFFRMKFPRANQNVCFDSTPISSHVIAAPKLADCVYGMEVPSNGMEVRSNGMEVRSNGMKVAIRLHFCPQCPSIYLIAGDFCFPDV